MPPRHPPGVYRRRRLAVTAAAVVFAAVLVVIWDHGRTTPPELHRAAVRAGAPPAAGTTLPVAASGSAAPPTSAPVATAPPVGAVDSGELPQTAAFPTVTSPQFAAEMTALWAAVKSGVPAEGRAAFFPEAAYLQVKTVPDPQSDWTTRLLDAYYGDIGAAHGLLGPGAAAAQLIGVHVYSGTAHWVTPGTCYNRVGYFEVPNSRLVYSVGGQVRSFGIASMISWRGEWYVVHLGAVIESAGTPTVDAPADGPGYPAPLHTC